MTLPVQVLVPQWLSPYNQLQLTDFLGKCGSWRAHQYLFTLFGTSLSLHGVNSMDDKCPPHRKMIACSVKICRNEMDRCLRRSADRLRSVGAG
jgi:hypothetical protein